MTTMIRVTYDENLGEQFVTGYACTNEFEKNRTSVSIDFLFDMAYDMNYGRDLSLSYVESSLLQQLASYYGLWDGTACVSQSEDRIWFVNMSSLTADVPNPYLESCYALVSGEGEGCTSFMGTMTGQVIGSDDTLDTVEIIARQLNSGAVTQGASMRVQFIGTELDYSDAGRDNLPPAISLGDGGSTVVPKNEHFTAVGVALVVALTLAVVGLVYALVRRRRRRLAAVEGHHTLEDDPDQSRVIVENEGARRADLDSSSDYNAEDNLPRVDSGGEAGGGGGYQFDMGGWMKSELLGIHGDTAITASPSRAEAEASSDSDNDSWAQTEATIGSLELRLDPIEAEV